MTKTKKYLAKLKQYWHYSAKTMAIAYRANKKATVIKLIGVIITALAPLGWSYSLKLAIDKIIDISQGRSAFNPDFFVYALAGFFGFEIVSRIAWQIIDYYDRITFLDLGKVLTIQATKKFSELDFEYWEDPKLNNMLNKVKENYSWRPQNFADRQFWLIANLFSVITNTFALIGLGPVYFFLIFISSVPEFIVGLKFSKVVWHINGAKGPIRRDFWNTSSYLTEESHLKEVHIFGIGKTLLSRVENLYRKFFGYHLVEINKMFKSKVWTALFAFAISVITVSTIILKAITGAISIGALNFYIGRLESLSENLKGLFRNLSQSFEDLLYVQDFFEFLSLPRKININKHGKKVHPPFTIEFKDVCFKYPHSKKYVLKDFNLIIRPNQKIALIGENGAGKTTLIKLLARFYDVTGGKILINGHRLSKINLDHWRKHIGALFQDFNRYSYTVLENVKLGNVSKPFSKEIYDHAVKKAGADEFINTLAKKEETILSKQFKGGTDLSTGQWQKIALARAFFRNAPLLILDEPTSAIDAKSESEIFNQIHTFEKGKVVIMISHRFSTVRNADKIYVIAKGKITESGSHKELMSKNGAYAKLFKLQAQSYKD